MSLSVLSLGSNIPPRTSTISKALRLLQEKDDIKLVDSSFMYLSEPMYVTDQERFANCAVIIETTLDPHALLHRIKQIERTLGRDPTTVRNGPRPIDIDILFYNELTLSHLLPQQDTQAEIGSNEGELIIPHPRIAEREFVLRPVADLIPSFLHPSLNTPIHTLLSSLPPPSTLRKILPLPSSSSTQPENYWSLPADEPHLMATLNVTPDSFSDGGQYSSPQSILEFPHEGASIIDIGGHSTRPHAPPVPPEVEESRVLSALSLTRSTDWGKTIPISVDTFRASVARSAIKKGANMINDISALAHDPLMLSTAAELDVPVIMMHSRGVLSAHLNKDYSQYLGGVLEGVRTELGASVAKALKGGVKRWNIIIDPGIGFSKSVEDNCTLLAHSSSLVSPPHPSSLPTTRTLSSSLFSTPLLTNLPLLIGPSRKSFLPHLTHPNLPPTPPKERGWATSACVAAAVQQEADFIRVHDTKEMRDVVRVACGIWRRVVK